MRLVGAPWPGRGAVRRARGFTLVEMLVAIALFSLLMSTLYGGMTTAVRAYDAAEARTAEGARMRVVGTFLRRSLASAFPMAVAEGRDWKLLFEGGDGRVRYVADLPGYVGVGGLHEIVIEAEREPGAGHGRLMMRRRPLLIDEDGTLRGEFSSRVLLDEVDGFDVRFYGPDGDGDDTAWHDRWPAGKQLPLLVELRIRDPQGGDWSPLTARLQVDAIRYQGTGAVVPGAPAPRVAAPAAGAPAAPVPQPVPLPAPPGVPGAIIR